MAVELEEVYWCEVHGFYGGGFAFYCPECQDDEDRPHDVWGDETVRIKVSV